MTFRRIDRLFDSHRNMGVPRMWIVIFVVAAACTCGARTECSRTAQISFLTSVHDDPSCTKVSAKGVMLYEAANLLVEIHNNKTDGYDIGITVLDTCGSMTGTMKAMMKALVQADVNCLHPPSYLGIIGPDTLTNAEVVHKVTSILHVPHIVKEPSESPYLHHLAEESDSYLMQGILKMINTLHWKSFTLVVNDDHNDDDVQNIAKQLTIRAIAENLCVIVHDDDSEDYTSHIVYIGKPEKKFLIERINATIVIISEGSLKNYLARINSSNTILLLEDSRSFSDFLESRVENSHWWEPEDDDFGKYDAENLREVRWLENAVEVYIRALKAACKNKKCKSSINSLDWNHIVSNMLMTRNAESRATPRYLEVSMKTRTSTLEQLGDIVIRENEATLYWKSDKREDNVKEIENRETSENKMPKKLKKFINRDDEPQTGCATSVKQIKTTDNKEVLVSGMNDDEWWTTVWTVSGVGVAMFIVGAFAVYIIYANIVRGPRGPKSKGQLERDSSLRRTGSDRELPVTTRTQQRARRAPQRTDSNRSNVSEKSV